jgi:hypothetical protein
MKGLEGSQTSKKDKILEPINQFEFNYIYWKIFEIINSVFLSINLLKLKIEKIILHLEEKLITISFRANFKSSSKICCYSLNWYNFLV